MLKNVSSPVPHYAPRVAIYHKQGRHDHDKLPSSPVCSPTVHKLTPRQDAQMMAMETPDEEQASQSYRLPCIQDRALPSLGFAPTALDDVTPEDTIPYPPTPRLPQASLYIDPEEATDDSNALANGASLRHPQRISCSEGNISLLLYRLDRLCILYGVDLAEFYLAWRYARNNQELQLWVLDSVTAAIEGTMEINIEIESAPPTLETLTRPCRTLESDLPKSPQDYRKKFPVISGIYGPQVSIRTLYLVVIGTVKLLPSILPYVFWVIMGDNDDRSILRFASVNGKMIGKKLGYMFIESENINGVLDGWLGLRDHMAWMKRFTKAMDMPYFRWPLNQEEKDLIKLGSDLLRLVPQE